MYRKLLVDKPYVEIAGIKWATMNIGANSETNYGLYFQFGDTTGYTSNQCGDNTTNYKKPFYYSDCVLHNGTSVGGSTTFTKYTGSSGDKKTVLEETDDAAVANWGGKWRIPTIDEFRALKNAVDTEWITNYNNSGINGLLCTDKTDNSKRLFFPAAGECCTSGFYNAGSYGYYWSSSLPKTASLSFDAQCLIIDDDGFLISSGNSRYYGFSVRPVWDDSIE